MPKEETKPLPFLDPYKDHPDLCRLQTWVSRPDHDFIQGIRPQKSTFTTVTNTLFIKFCEAVRKKGYDSQKDKVNFEKFVQEFEITITKKTIK